MQRSPVPGVSELFRSRRRIPPLMTLTVSCSTPMSFGARKRYMLLTDLDRPVDVRPFRLSARTPTPRSGLPSAGATWTAAITVLIDFIKIRLRETPSTSPALPTYSGRVHVREAVRCLHLPASSDSLHLNVIDFVPPNPGGFQPLRSREVRRVSDGGHAPRIGIKTGEWEPVPSPTTKSSSIASAAGYFVLVC